MSNITDNPKIQVLKAGCSGIFTNYIYKAIPLAFDESMSYYETLAGLLAYLKDVILPTVNGNAEAVAELQELYIQLNDYVTNYFDNLDVQEEINNKLDQMVEDGTFESILSNYTQVTKVFDTYNDMIFDTSTYVNGMKLKTLGYHFINDGGGAEYFVTNVQRDTKYQVSIGTNLWIELIIKDNTIQIKQLGAYGDDTNDDTQIFKNAINFIQGKFMNLYINAGKYILTDKIVVNWSNTNFWQNFNGSYSIKGAGIFETILKFNTKDGMHVDPSGILSIELSNFSIINKDYDPLTETGNERTPTDSKGIGLLLRGIGYTGHVSRIGVRGFYVGIATRQCYDGPILDNLFTGNCVFGFSSRNDTSNEHNSCNYQGIESCYIQEGSTSTLKNIVCENNITYFKYDNEHNQRGKFEGRGYSFYNCKCTMFGCYTEKLYGNSRYIKNSRINDINGIFANDMIYTINMPEYAELKYYLENINPNHNYFDFNILFETNYNSRSFVKIENGQFKDDTTAYVDTNTPYATTVIFEGVSPHGDFNDTKERFYKGPSKPIIKLSSSSALKQQNYGMIPEITRGVPYFLNDGNAANYNGFNSFSVARKSDSFSNTDYNEVELYMRHTLDGSIRFYKKTKLDDETVTDLPVITISPDGKVTFPQN